jgi:hypothetical protein
VSEATSPSGPMGVSRTSRAISLIERCASVVREISRLH